MATPFLFEKDMTLRRLRQREGWPPPFLLFFLRGMVRCPSPFFLLFYRGWEDGRPHPLLRKNRTKGITTSLRGREYNRLYCSYYYLRDGEMAKPLPTWREIVSKKKNRERGRERGTATSSLTILPWRAGEMATSVLLYYFSVGDGETATSSLMILL